MPYDVLPAFPVPPAARGGGVPSPPRGVPSPTKSAASPNQSAASPQAKPAQASPPPKEPAEECAVTVAVRVRPLSKREREREAQSCLTVERELKQIAVASASSEPLRFTFDHLWDETDSQAEVYSDIGAGVVSAAFSGYNACVFAYGQTGSGKTHTMLGPEGGEAGLIPRLCREVFERASAGGEARRKACKVEAAYLEIYQEQVRCLLNPNRTGLRVREHPSLGPYVEGLTKLVVDSAQSALQLIDDGAKVRKVAETKMNEQSSRSHAIFTLTLTQTRTFDSAGASVEKEVVSKINLVDLAGSERAKATGATGERLAEGAQINRSLTALGLVISSLADASKRRQQSGRQRVPHIPYRDSTLTWLLKDNLGGNSRTTMVSAVSPADINREETVSTLRYADRAKAIVSKVTVNEDPTTRLIRQLREEISKYQEKIQAYESGAVPIGEVATGRESPFTPTSAGEAESLRVRLEVAERLMHDAGATWAEREERSRSEDRERREVMAAMGLTVRRDTTRPCLVSLTPDEDDWLLQYCTVGEDVVLRCLEGGQLSFAGAVDEADCILHAGDSHGATITAVSSVRVSVKDGPAILDRGEAHRLRHGDEFSVGEHRMRFSDPRAPAEEREAVRLRRQSSVWKPPEPQTSVPKLSLQGLAGRGAQQAATARGPTAAPLGAAALPATARAHVDPTLLRQPSTARCAGLPRRRVVVVHGAAGSGKSSVLRCLAHEPTFFERRALPATTQTFGTEHTRVAVGDFELLLVDSGGDTARSGTVHLSVPPRDCSFLLVARLNERGLLSEAVSDAVSDVRRLLDCAAATSLSAQVAVVLTGRDRRREPDADVAAATAEVARQCEARLVELRAGKAAGAPILIGSFAVSCKTRTVVCGSLAQRAPGHVTRFRDLARAVAAVPPMPPAPHDALAQHVACCSANGVWALSPADFKRAAVEAEPEWAQNPRALGAATEALSAQRYLLHYAAHPILRRRVFTDYAWFTEVVAAPFAAADWQRSGPSRSTDLPFLASDLGSADPQQLLSHGLLTVRCASAVFRKQLAAVSRGAADVALCISLLHDCDLAMPAAPPEGGERVAASSQVEDAKEADPVYLIPALFPHAAPPLLLRVVPDALLYPNGVRRVWTCTPALPSGLYGRLLVRLRRCVRRVYFGPAERDQRARLWSNAVWIQDSAATRGLLWVDDAAGALVLRACGGEAGELVRGIGGVLKSLAPEYAALTVDESEPCLGVGTGGGSPRQRRLAALQRAAADDPVTGAAIADLISCWAGPAARGRSAGEGFRSCGFCGNRFTELCDNCPLCGEAAAEGAPDQDDADGSDAAAPEEPPPPTAAECAAALRPFQQHGKTDHFGDITPELAKELWEAAAGDGKDGRFADALVVVDRAAAATANARRLDELCSALVQEPAARVAAPAGASAPVQE
eukprot:TRINITY_DN2507_c3_g1_i1.p1 TRINITY_DN2507_c3_g1~~TRINITY_DN2507_c3_g1_i1.p1  ORF type:complete len:1422 (+),score=495.62 TRINITY_DN2507_c3_g1_i1:66-4331(+)